MAQLALKTTESTSRTQTQTFTIPGLTKLNGATVNTGTVEIVSIVGDKVTVKTSGGSVSRSVQTGGSYTPADSKTVGDMRTGTSSDIQICYGGSWSSPSGSASTPSSISYSSGGYSGTLSRTSTSTGYSGARSGSCTNGTSNSFTITTTAYYSGTATRPASDTRTYAYYYQYSVTFNYETNREPTLTLSTSNNQTLYENDTFSIDGTAEDTDIGNVVIVRYQINNGTVVAIETKVSDGTAPIPFSRQFTFKSGKLHYNGVAITGALAEGTAHKLKVWAVDDQGGQSEIAERTFYVVPNRAPSLTIDPFESLADLIDADKVTMSGDSFDLDGNDVIVRYRTNNGINTEIHNGAAGRWAFDFPLSKLKDGENTIVVEVVDTYDFKASKTIKLNKTANLTPLAQSVQRYTIVPPAGSAQGVLLWVERDESQPVNLEISMTNGTEPEDFKPMTLDSSGPANVGTVEDFFKLRADVPTERIAIKLSWTGDKPIYKISGALTQ